MRLWPEEFAEVEPNLQRAIELLLKLIEEVVCGPQGIVTGGPGVEEAKARILRAWERRDKKAEDAATKDCMRAQLRESWQTFPERELLIDLYQRAARRREGRRSPRSERPSLDEGLRVARAMLADVAVAARFDVESESETVSNALADQWVSLNGEQRLVVLRKFIKRSQSNPVYFDALGCIGEKLDERGKSIPSPLAWWRAEVASRRRRSPGRKPIPPRRPVTPARLVRAVDFQLTIAVLDRVGIKPRGAPSGCDIVAEVLGQIDEASGNKKMPHDEGTIRRIWDERPGKGPFEPQLRKQMKAIAERNGPFHPH